MKAPFKLSCILFDLDGTLVDTAPDLIASLNIALTKYGYKDVQDNEVKPLISYGAKAMIKKSIGEPPNDTVENQILEYMLQYYEQNIAERSQFFSGIEETLQNIESLGLKWGIVTNKRKRFTLPLVNELNLSNRAACIISGDSTANSKPHPEPMLTACKIANVEPEQCVYIGDAQHDIEAGKNANMKTLAALYGYLKSDDKPFHWGADGVIHSPSEISNWINNICY